MRKYIFVMGIILLSLILVSIEPTYGLEEENQNLTFHGTQRCLLLQKRRKQVV